MWPLIVSVRLLIVTAHAPALTMWPLIVTARLLIVTARLLIVTAQLLIVTAHTLALMIWPLIVSECVPNRPIDALAGAARASAMAARARTVAHAWSAGQKRAGNPPLRPTFASRRP